MNKMQKIIILFMLTVACTFCASKKSEPKAQQNNTPATQAQKRDSITVSVLYPADDRNGVTRQFRTMSESDIKSNFNELLGRMFPEENRARVRSMNYKSFSRYVAQRTAADPKIQAILSAFDKSGVYFFVKDKSKTETKSRYGDNSHIALTRGWAYTKMKTFIEDNTDLEGTRPMDQLDNLLGGRGSFAKHVKAEDYKDLVFGIGNEKLEVAGETLLDTGDISEYGLITVTHFWNPDCGWNCGNNAIWPLIDQIMDKNIPGWDDAQNLVTPEYVVKLLRRPPSAFYKALCLWYGWREIEWKQEGNIISNEVFNSKDNLHPGIDTLRFSDKAKSAEYLAHVLHLLQDMTVPAHVLNDAHGGFGGADWWESGFNINADGTENTIFVTVRKIINDVLSNESYKIEIKQGSDTEEGSQVIYHYTSKDDREAVAGSKSFGARVKHYYEKFNNVNGIWPLFFSTAQAGGFFPTMKLNGSGGGYISKHGNTTIAGGGKFYLDDADGFKAEKGVRPNYNHEPNFNEMSMYLTYNNNGANYGEGGIDKTAKKINFTMLDLLYQLKKKAVEALKTETDTNKIAEWQSIVDGIDGSTAEEIKANRLQNIQFLITPQVVIVGGKEWTLPQIRKFKYIHLNGGVGKAITTTVDLSGTGSDVSSIALKLIDEHGAISGVLEATNINGIGKNQGHAIAIYTLIHPFNKMEEVLLPLAIAVSTKLLENYMLFYN